jgi:hypothetical protein
MWTETIIPFIIVYITDITYQINFKYEYNDPIREWVKVVQ